MRLWTAMLLLAGTAGADRFAHASPDAIAKALVLDRKLGFRAIEGAVARGDDVLEPIRRASEDFKGLDTRNTPWLAEVFGRIRTEACGALLRDLYGRETQPLTRLVGAAGLMAHGVYPGRIGADDDVLTVAARGGLLPCTRRKYHAVTVRTAVWGLGHSRSDAAVDILLELLVLEPGPDHNVAARFVCEALARTGSKRAIPALRRRLVERDLHPVDALIALRDRQVVPLAIRRLAREEDRERQQHVARRLAEITGRHFGTNAQSWQRWWDSVATTWELPER